MDVHVLLEQLYVVVHRSSDRVLGSYPIADLALQELVGLCLPVGVVRVCVCVCVCVYVYVCV